MTEDEGATLTDSRNAFQCVTCSTPLPIDVCPECHDAVSVACAFCGTRYRAVLQPGSDDAPIENVRTNPDL